MERCCFRAETRQPFKPCELITVHRTGQSNRGPDGSMRFSHGTIPYLKRTMKLNGSQVSSWTIRSGPGLTTLAKSPEVVHPYKAFGWVARDTSGLLSPFNFSRRSSLSLFLSLSLIHCLILFFIIILLCHYNHFVFLLYCGENSQ